jgi:threonine/homoserine/homoserine lactone efflux protein
VIAVDRLLTFSAAAFALIVIPGPSVLFVVGRGMALGRRAALATVVGNETGQFVQIVLIALGAGAIVERSVAVYTAFKLVGAAYLVVLGLRAIRRRHSLAHVVDAALEPRRAFRIMREGFVVGVSNPKSLVFFAAILPQFVDQSLGSHHGADAAARPHLHRHRARVRQRVGHGGGDGAGVAQPLTPPSGRYRRGQRRRHDRARARPRVHRPQGLATAPSRFTLV